MKIQGLVSDEFTTAIDALLTSLSNSENMSTEILHNYLQENVKEFWDKVEGDLVDQIVNAYDISYFRHKVQLTKNTCDQVVQKNEKVFLFLHAYIEVAQHVFIQLVRKISKAASQSSKLDSKDFTFIALYGNLCRQADQIYLMLINGHPDAAMRLWRTFYEHCVIAIFLMKNNSNELTERFRDSTIKGHKKIVESYSKRHGEFNLPPLDESVIKKTHEEFDSLKDSYGKDFLENDYSWAKPYLHGKNSFMAVEEIVGMERYRPYYIRSSGKVHPTFFDITDFRDERGKLYFDRMIKPDSSRINIIDPAQLTMGCFCDVNSYFLELYSGHEYEINLMLFERIWKKFAEALNN